MLKKILNLCLISLLISRPSFADISTSTISAFLFDGSGNAISSTGGSLNSSITNTVPVSQSGSWTVSTTGTTTISGTVTSNQGTSPWVDNITQFGGTNISTGTGSSGSGIPRVTVSNDSNVLATQSGSWTTGRTWSLLNSTDSVNAVQSGTWTVQQGSAPWSVSQSGTWTTGRTWTLASGTDSISSVQSSSPWVDNISQFGGNNVVTGTGVSGSGIPRVTISNDSNILATQSGTWNITNVSGTVSLPTGASTATNQTAIQGSASGGTAATNSQLGGLIYNTLAPSLSNGQQAALQGDTSGNLNVNLETAIPAGSNNIGSITNVTGTVSLPTGAATSANQTNASQKTQIVDGSGTVIGPANSISGVNYLPVTLAASVATGSAVPTHAIQIGGTNGTNLTSIGVQSLTTNPPSGAYYLQVMPMTYLYMNLTGAATTTVKSGAGILHEFCVNDNSLTSTAILYDNTAGSGTIIASLTETSGGGDMISVNCVLHDVNFNTGLTVVRTGTTANYTAIYK